MRRINLIILLLLGTWIGCGTSKWSDTQRTATEQLLISDAMDRAVSQLDFRALAGKNIYLDTAPLKSMVDSAYLTSTLRQHLLATGCILKEKQDEADYIVEARAGSIGTDNHSLLFGTPQTTVPSPVLFGGTAATSSTIPEIPLAKKSDQRAIVKVAMFAYNRRTGRPIWQSGIVMTESKAKHLWVFGAGPFQRGTIYEGTKFAGDRLKIPLVTPDARSDGNSLSVNDEAYFIEPPAEVVASDKPPAAPAGPGPSNAQKPPAPGSEVKPASHSAPAPAKAPVPPDKPKLVNPFADFPLR